jgi:hypothetical protein
MLFHFDHAIKRHRRDHLFANLKQTGQLSDEYTVDEFHTQREGRNGGGDRWFTDGGLRVGVIAESGQRPAPPAK